MTIRFCKISVSYGKASSLLIILDITMQNILNRSFNCYCTTQSKLHSDKALAAFLMYYINPSLYQAVQNLGEGYCRT